MLRQRTINRFIEFCFAVAGWLFTPLPSLTVKTVKHKYPPIPHSEISVIDSDNYIGLYRYAVSEIRGNRDASSSPQVEVVPSNVVTGGVCHGQAVRVCNVGPYYGYVVNVNAQVPGIGNFKRSREWLV